MSGSPILNIVILALVTLERVVELRLARRNTQRLLAHGAREHAPGHYPLIVALHASWLIALWWLAPGRSVDAFWLAMFVLLELARSDRAGRRGSSSSRKRRSSAAGLIAGSTIPIIGW